jgi:hypothetical protein
MKLLDGGLLAAAASNLALTTAVGYGKPRTGPFFYIFNNDKKYNKIKNKIK